MNAADRGHIDDHTVAHAFPHVQENKEKHPEIDVVIPVMESPGGGVYHMKDVVDQALIGGQEGVHEVADNNPAQEVGQEHHGLAGFGQLLGVKLVEQAGQGNGTHNAQDDEHDVVEDC